MISTRSAILCLISVCMLSLKAAPPKHIEALLLTWPAPHATQKLNPLLHNALFSIEQTLHHSDQPTPLDAVIKLADLSESLTQKRPGQLIAQGRWALNKDGPTTLWLNQIEGGKHLYGSVTIDKSRYFIVTADLVLEINDAFWSVHMHKKSKSGQINYVESMPIGLIFHIG